MELRFVVQHCPSPLWNATHFTKFGESKVSDNNDRKEHQDFPSERRRKF